MSKNINNPNYCDNINKSSIRRVAAASQLLEKEEFLAGISAYETLLNLNVASEELNESLKNIYHIINVLPDELQDLFETTELLFAFANFKTNVSATTYYIFVEKLKNFLNMLTDDYDFTTTENVPYAKKSNLYHTPNTIMIGMYPDEANADILLTEDDIQKALFEKYPIDQFVYNKLFIESKLKRLETENISCIVSGLSYTQYGILENKMPLPTVNLSITGQDTPYSILMAEYALRKNPEVEYIIIPMNYYQGCYDMSDDDVSLHKNVVSRVNIPILKNARNYKDRITNTSGYCVGTPLKIYDVVLDLDKVRILRDNAIRNSLTHMEYFNEINPQNPLGSLKFAFQELASQDEKYASAKITAEHNERICTEKGYLEVRKYLKPFFNTMNEAGKKLIIFVPPMTKYIYESYHKKLIDFYYEKIVTVLKCYDNITFLDLATEESFLDTDFCDFEHLNHNGAEKLTKIIAHTLK